MASAVASVIRLEPVVRERMADLETPVSAFAKLRRLGGAFLLESAEGGERMGRYSFIGVAPRELIVSRDGDPLTALRGAMARYARPSGGGGLPRFSGGAVGYVGYEAARHFERLPVAPHDPHGLPDAVFGIYDTVVAFDHLRHTMLLIAYQVLKRGCPYKDLGVDYFDRLAASGLQKRLVKKLTSLGFEVSLTPASEPAV